VLTTVYFVDMMMRIEELKHYFTFIISDQYSFTFFSNQQMAQGTLSLGGERITGIFGKEFIGN